MVRNRVSEEVGHSDGTPLDREEQMRRRDIKAMEKNDGAIKIALANNSLVRPSSPTSSAIEHRSRKGDRYWDDEEHERFLQAVRLYGKNWGEITRFVGTRSRQSVYSHAQKFRKRVLKEPNLQGADCAKILATVDSQHYSQSSIMRARTCAIASIAPKFMVDEPHSSSN